MLNLSCLCGRVRIELRRRPDYIHECNCTLCTRTGAHWSYFIPSEVAVEGRTTGYCREDKDYPNAQIHFCGACGSTTHFVLSASAVARFGNCLMGVNMWPAEPRELAGIQLRFPDGRSWPGEGEFAYLREALVIGA
mgnify:FL=1